MTANRTHDATQQQFCDALLAALVIALTQSSVSAWSVSTEQEAAGPEEEGELFCLDLTLTGSLSGSILLQFSQSGAALLAASCMRQPAADFSQEHAQALLQLMETAGGIFCQSQADRHGVFSLAAAIVPPPEAGLDAAMQGVIRGSVVDDQGRRVVVRAQLAPALAEAVTMRSADAEPALPSPLGIAGEQGNLDLVMGVELNVTLRFGQRKLTLREVLDLTSGSVIELDRQVEEPVELLLEGRVIARGEAVVVDGNYGLRVTEVPRPINPASLR